MFKITFDNSSYIIDFISPTELKVRKLPSITVGMKKVTSLARPRLEEQPNKVVQEKRFGIIPIERLAKQGNDTKPKQEAKTTSVKELLLELGKQMGIQL